ncbi:hypothetical protein Bhyg_12576 [Pseudolycoriella hygida]|uniref:Uncharacterized protein n=1 Tax=Pseudolycoriella hygida TaxID=35572 RepID=A0A9Q0MYP2_9DIPT|nr:hypothetical protein Bhyg_12576 [Pseudolycoriella hygida]
MIICFPPNGLTNRSSDFGRSVCSAYGMRIVSHNNGLSSNNTLFLLNNTKIGLKLFKLPPLNVNRCNDYM